MIAFPNAKINLGLNIVSKREDGYHNIESGFYPIPWLDALEIIEAKTFAFHAYGLEIPGDPTGNLCVKAYELIREHHAIPPVEIHLLKNIPMGAGLGGGSADGAFTLTLLNQLFELQLSEQQLEVYALQLGSDCPYFIRNTPALASGRGQQLTPLSIDLKGHYLAIHNPGIHVSTREAYSGITPKPTDRSVGDLLKMPLKTWENTLTNDFEVVIFQNHPKIETLKKAMYEAGALYASMTGSGSTVYGIFDHPLEHPAWKVLAL